MNHYKFHLVDYRNSTLHLELLEDLAYRRLLDQYYKTQKPLALSVVALAKTIGMAQHSNSVRVVIDKYFEQTPRGWLHARCEREIEAFKIRRSEARAKLIAAEKPRDA